MITGLGIKSNGLNHKSLKLTYQKLNKKQPCLSQRIRKLWNLQSTVPSPITIWLNKRGHGCHIKSLFYSKPLDARSAATS